MSRARGTNLYSQLLEHIFERKYVRGVTDVEFERADIERAAEELGIRLPKNLGDVIYSFRYRNDLPSSVRERAPAGRVWVIRGIGRSRYAFSAVKEHAAAILPSGTLVETKVPDATPGIIELYALNDEQALLAILRYNRLIDVFTGATCYSLQSHLRTSVAGVGQLETDEVYIGVDKRGAHFVFPVQAKGGKDRINIVQIEQDIAMCAERFANAICRPIAAQFMDSDLIALFEFEDTDEGVGVVLERHYRLVPPAGITSDDLEQYARRAE